MSTRLFKLINTASVVLCSFVLQPVYGHDGDKAHSHGVRAVKPAEMYQPTPNPDRIILTWAGDPKTTQAVTWRTSTEVTVGFAELAIAGGGPDFAVI